MNVPDKTRRIQRQAAFTLLELIVVITIIGTLSTMVVIQVRHFPAKARAMKVKADLTTILKTADVIYVMTGRHPESLADLVDVRDEEGRLVGGLEGVPIDPWNNEYLYEVAGDQPQVICLGSDGAEGGEGEAADVIIRGTS